MDKTAKGRLQEARCLGAAASWLTGSLLYDDAICKVWLDRGAARRCECLATRHKEQEAHVKG